MVTKVKSKAKVNKNNSSGYHGVTGKAGKYVAQINYKVGDTRKTERLGVFKNPVEAAKAYDAKAIEIHGDRAKLNFPAKKTAE